MKLQQQRSFGGQNPVDKGDFFSKKKEEFLIEQQKKGWDMFAVGDWIEHHKLLSMDAYILEQNFQNLSYVNPLASF